MARTLTLQIRVCAACKLPFRIPADNYGQKTCSLPCRDEYNRQRFGSWAQDLSPTVWDGVTRYNEIAQRFDFWLTCLICGCHEHLRRSWLEAKAMEPRYCPHCDGRMLLEVDIGFKTPGHVALEQVA